jgi:hypothetical protein
MRWLARTVTRHGGKRKEDAREPLGPKNKLARPSVLNPFLTRSDTVVSAKSRTTHSLKSASTAKRAKASARSKSSRSSRSKTRKPRIGTEKEEIENDAVLPETPNENKVSKKNQKPG